jgi:hypothetical protein
MLYVVCLVGLLRFTPDGAGGFDFNTGVLRGKLRADGKSVGLLPVVHVPTGAILTRSMGLAGHYRVFSGARRFGNGAWYWPSEARLLEDGSVETRWPASDDRPFELSARYRWSGPANLEVVTTVQAREDLPDFESFFASYLSERFTVAQVRTQEGFVSAGKEHGEWQIFPRDPGAVALIRDGRWKLPPNPVDWVVRPSFDRPVAVRRDPGSGLAVVFTAPREECFAIATPHQAESHYSLYLSLFGRTLKAGERARARARIAVLESPVEREVVDVSRW